MNRALLILLSASLASCVFTNSSEEVTDKPGTNKPEVDPGQVISELTTAYTFPIAVFIVGSCTQKSLFNRWPKLEQINKLEPSIDFREYFVSNQNPFDVLFEIKSSSINWRVVLQTEYNDNKCLYELTADYQSGKRILEESGVFDLVRIQSGDGEQIVSTATRLSTNMFSKLIVIEPFFQVRINMKNLEEMINTEAIPSKDVTYIDRKEEKTLDK